MGIFNRKKQLEDYNFKQDALALNDKERQINAGGRQNVVDKIIAEDTTPDIEDPQPRKMGLLGGLKKVGKFVGDNSDIILPTAFGLSTGVGILPGLMAGYAGRRNKQATADDLEQEQRIADAKIAADEAKTEEMWKQKELDRQNKLKLKTTLSGDSLKEEKEFQTFLEAKQIMDDLKAKGMKDEEIKANYPDLSRIVYDYKQRKYYKRSAGDELSPDDPDNTEDGF